MLDRWIKCTKGDLRFVREYVDLKTAVADTLVELSNGFSERRNEITSDKRAVKYRIKASSEVIRAKAKQTVDEVKELVGLFKV